MTLKIPDVKFELSKVYKTYAEQLFLSGSISDILLDNSDIPAAGQQVEGALRILLSNLLPERVKVSHGHIVDKHSNISYQQDVLIAESFHTRSLLKSLDETEFYPFESIIATGEIKKQWSHTNLKNSIKSIKRNKEELSRVLVPPNVLLTGSNFVKVDSPLTNNNFRNPLFSFTFSLTHDNKMSINKIKEIYGDKDNWHTLPNISVVLDKGIYLLVDTLKLEENELVVKLYPEFVEKNENYQWFFLRLEPEESIAYLIFILTQHINDTILERVPPLMYSKSLLDISLQNLNSINEL